MHAQAGSKITWNSIIYAHRPSERAVCCSYIDIGPIYTRFDMASMLLLLLYYDVNIVNNEAQRPLRRRAAKHFYGNKCAMFRCLTNTIITIIAIR